MMKKINRKCASVDYAYSSLPQTRREQFFDVFRHNRRIVLRCGLILLLCSIPILLFAAFSDIMLYAINSNGKFSSEELENLLLWHDIISNLSYILLLFVSLMGVCVVLRVFRQLIWNEGIDFKYEFKMGLKQNYKPMAIGSIFAAIFYILGYLSSVFFLESNISFIPILIFCLTILPIYIWYLLLSNTYESHFSEYLRNSVFFYLKDFGFSLLFSLGAVIPLGLGFLPFQLMSVKFSIMIILLIIYYPSIVLVMILRSSYKFDVYLNEQYYPDLVRKGLFNCKQNRVN